MLVGYHAMAGASGVLAHTTSGISVHRIWLNGSALAVGEALWQPRHVSFPESFDAGVHAA